MPVAAVLTLGLALLAVARGDARYVVRVLWHRDSDITDVEWKAHSAVTATNPRPWPTGACPVADLPTHNAQSVVVVHAGKLVCQWYGNGGAADRPAAAFSVSKTVLSLLVARSVADGTLPGLQMPITTGIPELAGRDPRFGAITLADLVDMRSGIAFSQDVPFPWVNQDQPAVYYASDLARTVVERPVITSAPGPFTYNDYAPNLVGLAYQRLNGKLLPGAPLQQLWSDIGAQDPALWCVDDHGFPYHESGMVVTARDLARVGQLLLDNGVSSFTQRSLEATGPATTLGSITVGYHNGWWDLPGQDLAAMGDHGQILIVSPSTQTIVVRMGDDDGGNIQLATALQGVAHQTTFGSR